MHDPTETTVLDAAPAAETVIEPPARPAETGPESRRGLKLIAAIEPPAETNETAARPELDRILEAVLFTATAPVTEARLCESAECKPDDLAAAIERLNRDYETGKRAFRIHRIAQGFQFYTLPEYAEWVKRSLKHVRQQRLSRAGLETLAVIAYKQPVTKPEIEQYRGVDCTGPLATLLERRLVALAGRAHKPGNPFLYRTSREFLRYFGLASLADLPRREELEEFLRHRQVEADAESAAEDAELQPTVRAGTGEEENPDSLPATDGAETDTTARTEACAAPIADEAPEPAAVTEGLN
jgi:segregation and condensation protein B